MPCTRIHHTASPSHRVPIVSLPVILIPEARVQDSHEAQVRDGHPRDELRHSCCTPRRGHGVGATGVSQLGNVHTQCQHAASHDIPPAFSSSYPGGAGLTQVTTSNTALAAGLGLLGAFLAVQASRVKFVFDEDALEVCGCLRGQRWFVIILIHVMLPCAMLNLPPLACPSPGAHREGRGRIRECVCGWT